MATSKVAYLVKPKIVDGVEGEAIIELRDIEIRKKHLYGDKS